MDTIKITLGKTHGKPGKNLGKPWEKLKFIIFVFKHNDIRYPNPYRFIR